MSNRRQTKPLSRFNRPTEIGTILKSALRSKGIDKELDKYQFVLEWDQIVGREIAGKTTPEYLRGSTLVVKVSDSTWAQELSFQKDVIINRMNRRFGDTSKINDIRFVVE